MEKSIKQPTSYEEQLDKLKSRGCIIADEDFCKQVLQSVNYYRLTAYFLPFRLRDGTYKEDTNFQKVYRIYEFDRKLRGLLFSAIEEVEIYLRSCFAYYHAQKYGATGYLDAANYSDKHNHGKFIETIQREIENNKRVLFVKHHIENYGSIFPIWVIVELFTFGMLSYFYGDLITQDQKKVAKELYGTIPKNVISWLRCCTDLRNICAHYGRLYFRIFPAVPCGFNIPENTNRRLWGAVMALCALFPHAEKWNNEVLVALENLLEEYQADINLHHIAFPENWQLQLRK